MKTFLFLTLLNNVFSWRFIPIKKIESPKSKCKLISISPAGFYGLYTLGISSFIKENYNLKEFNYLGASSGSWVCLLSCYKHNNFNLVSDLINQEFIKNPKSAFYIQSCLKSYLLDKYTTDDFNLNKLYISLSHFKNFKLSNLIFNNFTSLPDAIDCCIASSHIPFITSNSLLKIYKGKIVFDGGFTDFPPKSVNSYFVIKSDSFNYSDVNSAFFGLVTKNISKLIASNNYNNGYKNSIKNKKILDKYFNDGDYLFYMDYL